MRGRDVLECPGLRAPGLTHGFTARALGTAAREPSAGDDAVARALGPSGPSWRRCQVRQVHGARAVRPAEPLVEADALVSDARGDLLVIRVADCLPILAASLSGGEPRAVAALHAGWRGLVAGVVETGIGALRSVAPAQRIVAAIGPSIGPCCFEVGPEVAFELARLGEGFLSPGRGDRIQADLWGAAVSALERQGVEVACGRPPCTRCAPERFHSHRASGAAAGRMAAFIGLDAE